MRKKLSLLYLLQLSTITFAATVKNLVVFGDSNSDVGNGQRWSNGPLWSEYLALGWNASLYSFAFSGSVCDNGIYNSISKEDKVPSLRDQLEGYYKLGLDLNPQETVYAFWFGVQDVYEMAKRHGKRVPDYKEITDCIGQQLRAARKVFLSDKFLVLNVPPLGQMPYYQDTEVGLNRSQAAIDINKALEKDVANLNKHHHALEMDYVDIHSLVDDMIVDPTVFQFKNSQDAYLDTCNEKCKLKEDDYIWWDQTHFTSAFHKTIAKSIIEAESYMPKVTLTKQLEKQLQTPHSPYHSKSYTVQPFTGIIDEQAKLYDLEKSAPTEPLQPPLEDDAEDYKENKGHTFIGFSIFIVLVLVLVACIKFPNASIFSWFRKDRGKFIPVRNEEV